MNLITEKEMQCIRELEQPQSDIESYVNTVEKLFTQQIDQITIMRTRLLNFKHLLKEEEQLSNKIMRINEMYGSMYADSFRNSNCNTSQLKDLESGEEF